MRRLAVWALLASLLVVGCSRQEEKKSTAHDDYVYEPVRTACAYVSLIEKPDATKVLLLGEEAKRLAPVYARAGVKPYETLDGTYDIILLSCEEISSESCRTAAARLKENGVMAWMMDVRGVTAGKFRTRVRSFALEGVHLWMPGADRWLLVGRKSPRTIKLEAMLDVFAREKAFEDVEKMRCGTLAALFAGYAGTREEILPAFSMLPSADEIRPANFLSSKVGAVGWISDQGMDRNLARQVLSEIRSMQVVRRQVVEGDLMAEKAADKQGEERATEIWARSFLRNPNDLFLLERIDRLERNAKGFLAVGKVLPAMKCYETIVLISPDDAAAVHNFGMCLKKIGKVDLATKALQRAEELAKRTADAP